MKLNLGCGFNKIEGFINVDMFKECEPDLLHNLEIFPYPFKDDSVSEILLNHSLEHLGQQPVVFIKIMQELYRISKNESLININVPHPNHDNFISDPTHVRAITPMTLQLFDLELNRHWQNIKAANSPLAIYSKVNFKLIENNIIVDDYYMNKVSNEEITINELNELIKDVSVLRKKHKE